MIVRTSVAAALFLTASLFAASSGGEEDRAGQIQSKLNSIINKAGIHFNGQFRSQYLQSSLDVENSGDSAIDWTKKKTESTEFTSVDFDIGARPNEALSARCMFRMHQNWQNFFSDVSNPIFLRWLSIDGNIKDMFRFNVGDYRTRYSPLTLWSPDIEIAYEPEIFAEKRRIAQEEVFLGNNDRLLQGVNLNFDAEVVPIFNELHINGQVARLRLQEANITNGSAPAALFEVMNTAMDRYFAGANLDLIALKGLGVGGTFMSIFDLESTYDGVDTAGRLTTIAGFRLNPTTKMFVDGDVFEIGLKLEGANSRDRDSSWWDVVVDPVDSSSDSTRKYATVSGLALDAGLNASVKLGSAGSIKLNVGFMSNDPDYRNEMAQSPTFLGQRIMNIENDWNKDPIQSARLYTTFDALYDYVFKFTPSANNNWTKEPHRKISYLNAILSPEECRDTLLIDKKNVRFDPALQTVLPYGAATPNRSGLKGDLALKLFNNGVDASVNFAMLNQVEADIPDGVKTAFTKFGGGLSVDIATWAKVLNCMKLSGGYSLEGANDKTDAAGHSYSLNSGFLNLGFYYNFWQRFSLLGGFQQITTKEEDVTPAQTATATVIQTHWAAGLEYKVNEGQKIIARAGQIGADFENSVLPDESNNFKATQVEAYILVKF